MKNSDTEISKIWNFFLSDDMILNLTSELIGIIVTIIVVSFAGGWFVARTNRKHFDVKWQTLRRDLAESILVNQNQLDNESFNLGQEMQRIADKDILKINEADLDVFRSKMALCIALAEQLDSIVLRYHFALREEDVGVASSYAELVRIQFTQFLQHYNSQFAYFDAMLTTHLQNTNQLDDLVFKDKAETTRHDILVASSTAAQKQIKKIDRISFLAAGRQLSTQLKL